MEIMLADFIRVFPEMAIEITVRSSDIITVEISKKKFQKERSGKQRHKEFFNK